MKPVLAMFDKLQDNMKQAQFMMRLMNDDRFKALISHPKVHTLLKDPEFQQVIQLQELAKIAVHPRLASLFQDPELVVLFSTIDPQQFLRDAA